VVGRAKKPPLCKDCGEEDPLMFDYVDDKCVNVHRCGPCRTEALVRKRAKRNMRSDDWDFEFLDDTQKRMARMRW